MAETLQPFDENGTVQPSKPLNPAPAVPEGEYPELSPNPNFKGENVKGSDQAEDTHPSVSGERPQVFKDVVLDILKAKKDIYVRGKKIEDYIDSQGGVTEAEMETYVKNNASNIYEVSNIQSISKTILDALKAGDVVQKITGNSKHTYVVSYKGEGAGTGICLTYAAAGYIETVSYDRSGSNWVYNSTDVTEIGETIKANSSFIFDAEKHKFIVVDDIPEDYTGIALDFGDDGLYIDQIINGEYGIDTWIGFSGIEITSGDSQSSYSNAGASKVLPSAITGLTHSFTELDDTLQTIIADAITDGNTNGVACTQAQWDVIKTLLDASLYINHNGTSMIKTVTDGINIYSFGGGGPNLAGVSLSFYYDPDDTLLYAEYIEV